MLSDAARKDVLEAMGVVPMVLRTRSPQPPSGTPKPVATPPRIVVESPRPVPREAPKVVAPAPKPKAEPKPAVHLAVVQAEDWLIMAQLPEWAGGMLEANGRNFLRDVSLYLPGQAQIGEVLALDAVNHTQYGNEALVGLARGRLTRAVKQGVRRALLLTDWAAIATGVPDSMALYSGPGLETLFNQPDAKKALWTTLVKMNSN